MGGGTGRGTWWCDGLGEAGVVARARQQPAWQRRTRACGSLRDGAKEVGGEDDRELGGRGARREGPAPLRVAAQEDEGERVETERRAREMGIGLG